MGSKARKVGGRQVGKDLCCPQHPFFLEDDGNTG